MSALPSVIAATARQIRVPTTSSGMSTFSSNFRPCPSRLLRSVMLSVSFCAPAAFVGCVGTTTVDSTATVERLVEQRQYDADAVVEDGSESIDPSSTNELAVLAARILLAPSSRFATDDSAPRPTLLWRWSSRGRLAVRRDRNDEQSRATVGASRLLPSSPHVDRHGISPDFEAHCLIESGATTALIRFVREDGPIDHWTEPRLSGVIRAWSLVRDVHALNSTTRGGRMSAQMMAGFRMSSGV